ncbi:hypothetical protein SELMODRAFT_413468 [Selaginella moellendorffii]|uniref:Uncharacterized protein n=1 Tax=Selaginella moellendorffii TaxID=88036 RepID=D8RPK0_SELML|nr:uncharacterized protein LOC9636841 isoform X1 [Selaginella moellendorffii]EFJ26055.1 hypothetical protein SELMODRAFT_413468 [Selaginella moellendorffii]|eukprot:XP_002972834.1 uncharacterized protein LOC9636841 isoform X1 [Selaginella moellendorffii]
MAEEGGAIVTKAAAAALAPPPPPPCAEGKENVAPDGEKGIIGSPLPDGFPRRPLQDITQVLESDNRTESITITCTGQSKTTRAKKGTTKTTTTCKGKENRRCKSRTGLEQVVLVTSSKMQQAEGDSPTVETLDDIKQAHTPSQSTVHSEQTTSRSRHSDGEKQEDAAAEGTLQPGAAALGDEGEDSGVVLRKKKRKSQAQAQATAAAKPKHNKSSILKFR